MVRVGGGWDTLENYLNKHDPCRCQRHRQEKHIRQVNYQTPLLVKVLKLLAGFQLNQFDGGVSNLQQGRNKIILRRFSSRRDKRASNGFYRNFLDQRRV